MTGDMAPHPNLNDLFGRRPALRDKSTENAGRNRVQRIPSRQLGTQDEVLEKTREGGTCQDAHQGVLKLGDTIDRTERRHEGLKEGSTQPDTAFTTIQTEAVNHKQVVANLRADNISLEEELDQLRYEAQCHVDEHDKDMIALESRFLTEYGLAEDEIDALRKENQVLRGDLAQATANVEGLKMQMETSAETAESMRQELVSKLVDEQAEYNKLEDDRDYLRDDNDELSQELEALKADQDALQLEKTELAKRVSSLEERNLGLEQQSINDAQQLNLLTKENVELTINSVEPTKAKATCQTSGTLEQADTREAQTEDLQGKAKDTWINENIKAGGEQTSSNGVAWSQDEERSLRRQDCQRSRTDVDEEGGILAFASIYNGSRTCFNVRETEQPLNSHLLIQFQSKVEAIQQALTEADSNNTIPRSGKILFAWVGDLYDLLYQDYFPQESPCPERGSLHDDTPSQSAPDLAVDDHFRPHKKIASSDVESSEKYHGGGHSAWDRSSHTLDVVGHERHEQPQQNIPPERNVNGDQDPQSSVFAYDDLTDGPTSESSGQHSQQKASKWKKLSSRSRSFLGALHHAAPSNDAEHVQKSKKARGPIGIPTPRLMRRAFSSTRVDGQSLERDDADSPRR